MSLLLGDRQFVERVVSPPALPLYQFKPHSNPRLAAQKAAIEQEQDKHGFPDILQLGVGDGPRMELTKEWQLFIRDLNPNMAPEKVSALLSGRVAFTNGTSWDRNGDTPYQNWILGDNTDNPANPLPAFDKVRTCAYACHTGKEQNGELVLTVLNGNLPPPNISDVNPETHPWLFFHATIVWVNTNGVELSRVPFQQRAPGWGFDFAVTMMPLVSKYQIRVPLSSVEPVSEYALPYFNYP